MAIQSALSVFVLRSWDSMLTGNMEVHTYIFVVKGSILHVLTYDVN